MTARILASESLLALLQLTVVRTFNVGSLLRDIFTVDYSDKIRGLAEEHGRPIGTMVVLEGDLFYLTASRNRNGYLVCRHMAAV